jgi:hypothetical protein
VDPSLPGIWIPGVDLNLPEVWIPGAGRNLRGIWIPGVELNPGWMGRVGALQKSGSGRLGGHLDPNKDLDPEMEEIGLDPVRGIGTPSMDLELEVVNVTVPRGRELSRSLSGVILDLIGLRVQVVDQQG